MKLVISITCWLCFALTFTNTLQAQIKPDEKLKDTLIIHLKGDNQVHIIGSSLEEIAKYRAVSVEKTTVSVRGKNREFKQFNSPDSMKNLFLSDYQKAVAAESISSASRNIHYLVSKEGKRRMKASTDAYTEEPFNLENEIKRLEMNLPAYHFIIYDLQSAMEIHFYLEDSVSLALLQEVNLDEAVRFLAEKKEAQGRFYRFEIESENNRFSEKIKRGSKKKQFEAIFVFGLSVIGNQPTPTWGYEGWLINSNKYAHPSWRFGFGYSMFSLYNYYNGKFENIGLVSSTDAFISINRSKINYSDWIGLNIGLIYNDNVENFPKRSIRFGWHAVGPRNIIYSLDLIRIAPRDVYGKRSILAFSMKVPF